MKEKKQTFFFCFRFECFVFLVTTALFDSELSRLVQLHKQLTKRPKWLQKRPQNTQNGLKHDFSLNASQTRATVVLSHVETIKMGFCCCGVLGIIFCSIRFFPKDLKVWRDEIVCKKMKLLCTHCRQQNNKYKKCTIHTKTNCRRWKTNQNQKNGLRLKTMG